MAIFNKGDAGYLINIQLQDSDGTVLTDTDIVAMQYMIGDIDKYYRTDGDITYDSELSKFKVPFTAEETRSLANTVTSQIWVQFEDSGSYEQVNSNATNTQYIGKELRTEDM